MKRRFFIRVKFMLIVILKIIVPIAAIVDVKSLEKRTYD